ncbi:hypothetical protein ACFLUS_01685 [Chloroflexota bacterium]
MSSEKHSNTSNVIGFGSFTLAAGIAIFAVRTITANSWPTIGVVILVAIVLIVFYFKTILPIRHATKVANDLLDNIMDGTERDPAMIEAEWKKVIERKKHKSKKS